MTSAEAVKLSDGTILSEKIKAYDDDIDELKSDVGNLKSKTLYRGIFNQNVSMTFHLDYSVNYLLSMVSIGNGNIGENVVLAIVTTGANSSNTSAVNVLFNNLPSLPIETEWVDTTTLKLTMKQSNWRVTGFCAI